MQNFYSAMQNFYSAMQNFYSAIPLFLISNLTLVLRGFVRSAKFPI